MVCGGLRWFVVVCGGLWWIAVVCLLVIPLKFADDTKLYTEVTKEEGGEQLQEDLDKCTEWANNTRIFIYRRVLEQEH